MTQLFSKPQLQRVLKDLRNAGYFVRKTPQGYVVQISEEEREVLRALNGHRAYLVSYDDDLLTPAETK